MFLRNAAISLLVIASSLSAGTPNLSFKKGFPISHMQILLQSRGNLVPTVTLGYFGLSTKSSYSDEFDSGDFNFGLQVLMPKVGVRKMGTPSGDLTAYTLAELFYLLPFVSGDDLSDRDKKNIADSIDLLGVTVGYGVEYRVSPQFSIGSEVSLNTIIHATDYKSDSGSYTRETRTILGAVLTSFTMNYNFN